LPTFSQTVFSSVEDVLGLARALVNDTFPGIGGAEGRILTDTAPFTLRYLNSALRKLQRKLRLEGVTFPIRDNVILTNLTPVSAQDPSIQVFVGYSGYFDGALMHATPMLPSDLVQPLEVSEQMVGTTVQFTGMIPLRGIPSVIQGQWLQYWEWRNYAIYMPGSTQAKNLRLRYTAGQPPLVLPVPPANFSTTMINIADSADVLAMMVAAQYAFARGGATTELTALNAEIEDTISDMAQEYIRSSQSLVIRRIPYGGPEGGNTTLGSSGWNS
jgi:hypothetical protein